MLQPRKRKFILKIIPKGLLLCNIILLTLTQNLNFVKGEDDKNGLIKDKIKRGDRVIRHGDVNIVVLDDFDRRKISPTLGLLSTTARTFIQEGTTTEYATHIYGTTLGDKYAHIVSTGSKIYYDHVRPSKNKNTDAIITIPSFDSLLDSSEENAIIPSKVIQEKHFEKSAQKQALHILTNKEDAINKNAKSLKANVPSVSEQAPITLNVPAREPKKSQSQVSIKPAKVKLKNELPTFTVKQDSSEIESTANQIQNSEFEVDNAILANNFDKFKSLESTPQHTTTYFGFADFVTTAGNTVIIFTPKTKKSNFGGTITGIHGEPTLNTINNIPNTKLIPPSKSTNVMPISRIVETPKSRLSTTTEPEEQTEPIKQLSEITTENEMKNEYLTHSIDSQIEDVTTPGTEDYTTELVTEITTENIITTTTDDDLVKNKYVPLVNFTFPESSNATALNPTTELFTTHITTLSSPTTNRRKQQIPSVQLNTNFSTTKEPTEITTHSGTTVEMEEDEEKEISESNEFTIMGSRDGTTEKMDGDPIITSQPNKSDEEEVELIFKTLYTTYTYLTTYFEKSSTSVKSREEVVTNVVSSTLDPAFLKQQTDPAVAGLFTNHREGKYLQANAEIGRPSTSYYSTTTPLSNNEIHSSGIDVPENELRKPTPSLKLHPRLTQSSMKPLHSSPIVEKPKTLVYIPFENTPTIAYDHPVRSKLPFAFRNASRIPFKSVILKHTPLNIYKSTINHLKPSSPNNIQKTTSPQPVNSVTNEYKAPDTITSEKISFNSVIVSAPLISAKKSDEQSPKKIFLNGDEEDDQLSQESNTEEAHPSKSIISLQTSYTTYTYFTTIYKGSNKSDIISRLETVTNVNTEILKLNDSETVPLIEDSLAPVTYYTTYTYWTTFYKEGNTMIKSRQETVSNIETPLSVTPEMKSIPNIIPTPVPSVSFTEPVTYFTTFTYFTTSYIENSSVINSHLETITSVVDATKVISDLSSSNTMEPSDINYPVFQPTGLVVSNNNEKSHYTTKAFGTYVDGLYSQVPNTSSEIYNNPANTSSMKLSDHNEGVISIDEGKVIEAFNISTTYYTTKVIGTHIQQLYAELIETTSSVQVNTESNSNLINLPTVVLNDRIYQTGVLQLKEGSIVKQDGTTHYTTKIIGSVLDGQYTSVTETLSSIHINTVSHIEPNIKATSVTDVSSNIKSTQVENTSPFPPVIESSLSDISTEDEEEDKEKSKTNPHKSFTPVIRPFASRSRPTFLPKKKTSEAAGAATITKGVTPTIVASPALKSSESRTFWSGNKNRFIGGSRRSTSATVVASEPPTNNSARRFSRTKTSAIGSTHSLYSRQSNSKLYSIIPSSNKRTGFKSSITKTFDYFSQSSTVSRFRIRPTNVNRFVLPASTTTKLEEGSNEAVTEQALSSSDEEYVETAPPISTETSRKYNPFFKTRKPASSRSAAISTTTAKPATVKKTNSRKNDGRLTTAKPTTISKPVRTRPSIYTNNSNRLRLKPANSLFPNKSASQTPAVDIENNTEELEKEMSYNGEDSIELIDPDSDEKLPRNVKTLTPITVKPFSRRGRVKRQAEFGYKYERSRNQNSRYRRPSNQNTYPDYLSYDELEYSTEDLAARSVGIRNGYTKQRNNQHTYQQQPTYQQYQQYQSTASAQQPAAKIRPSAVSNTRTPFTLRDKSHNIQSTTSAPQRASRRTTRKYHESNSVTKRSRQRTYTSTTETPAYRNSRKQSTTRRTGTRSRYKDDYNSNSYSQPASDGTITVTYKIPTEVTIPIVNGKVTEYKNVVTAKPSIQILAPHQYNTVTGKNGLNTLQLPAENTETLLNGLVEVTRYIIQEFPTSSITFTPTTIRGRKTSFSHVVPSTVYEVKPEVSTITPQLNANAPLANLLLSQLLLGNLGIQPTGNPLLGLNQGTAVPLTEYRTKTTSYVTTITHSTSTVIPITFRNKEIKTTVVDSSTQIITATEYITESVVLSPTNSIPGNNNAQLQTLLLPALLQAQLLNQPPQGSTTPLDENADNLQSILDIPNPSKVTTNGINLENDDRSDDDYEQKYQGRKKVGRKSFDSPIEPAETSVVTLYLSGRKPGEFSTVLSTVTLDEDKSATLRKRHIDPMYIYELEPSQSLSLSFSIFGFDGCNDDHLDTSVRSGINDIVASDTYRETQSLESIIGDVGIHLKKHKGNTLKANVEAAKNTNTAATAADYRSPHFLLKTSAESAPFQWNKSVSMRSSREKRETENVDKKMAKKISSRFGKESRKNSQDQILHLAHHRNPDTVNWSEKVRIFGNRTPPTIGRRYVNNSVVTIIPAAVENKRQKDHSGHRRSDNNLSTVDDEGRGKYNLATKVMSNGVEVIVALDKSTLPGSPQLLRVLPTSNIRPITFTPHTVTDHMIMMLPHGLQDVPHPFVTKTYLTTYTYLTTMLEGVTTTTTSREKIVSNIVTENIVTTMANMPSADVHITLESSPILATRVYQTTYDMESIIKAEDNPQVIKNQQTISNTITAPDDFMYLLQPSEPSFNEINSGPSKDHSNEEFSIIPTEKLTVNIQTKNSNNRIEARPTLQASDVTKTYFVTYTYFSTILENGSTVIKSNIATSSDIVTEKYYVPLKKTKYPTSSIIYQKHSTPTPPPSPPFQPTSDKTIRIFATKTYITIFTYFTTLQDKSNNQTVIKSRTKTMQNLVTETLNPNILNTEYLATLKNSLKRETIPITATATLNNGQRLEITAVNEHTSTTPAIDILTSSLEENQKFSNDISNTEDFSRGENGDKQKPSKVDVLITSDNKTNETTYSFTTTVLHSPTVMKNGATLLPGAQIIKFTDASGNVSIIPVSDPVSKHPDSMHHQNKPDSYKIQMNNLLNFGSLGINGLTALKPVLNAMAGLWQNNVKSNVRNKPEVLKPIRPYLETNQIELNTKLKPPNRIPIYIPVGSLPDDNEEAGSEDIVEQYPDVNQRNNYGSFNKQVMEKPLVSGGGIPISPGQLITANTDVIVGTPSVLGPRPPAKKTNNEKSDVIGMKPPPVAQKISDYSEENNEHVVSNGYKLEDIVRIPPKPISPTFLNNGFQIPNHHIKFPPKFHHKPHIDQKIPMSSEVRFSQLPLNTPLSEVKDHIKNYSVKDQLPTIPVHSASLPETSSLNPLLVNVRPSQVAQVIIPHSGQTAFVFRDESIPHNIKGEIINDPSPYPEENVNPGFVGLQVYGPVNAEIPIKSSTNTIHLDIPINPYAGDGTLTQSHHFVNLNLKGQSQSTPFSVVSSVLKPPLNNKFNFTIQDQSDIIKAGHPYVWQRPETSHNTRPYIFPQSNKPINEVYFSSNTEGNVKDYNFVNYDNESEQPDYTNDAHLDGNDGLTQETKIKPSSNPNTSDSKPKEAKEDLGLDYEFNQNLEILKEKPVQILPQNRTETNIITPHLNSTTREHPHMKYDGWTSLEVSKDTSSNEVNATDINIILPSSNTDLSGSSGQQNITKSTIYNRSPQKDVVIGLNPPPLPPPAYHATSKLSRPTSSILKPNPEHKFPHRPPLKKKPKPINAPYPFEKPTPSPVISARVRPTTIISKPPPNILYETDAPNFSEELMKLKPLNMTGKIEPVKKLQKSNSTQPVFGNIEKIYDTEKKDEVSPTTLNSVKKENDTVRVHTDPKIIVVEKPDRTPELIPKWNGNGMISSSKTNLEDNEYHQNTPSLDTNKIKSNSNTIFGNLFTRPPPTNIIIIPTHSITQHYTAISMVIDQEQQNERDSGTSFSFDSTPGKIMPTQTQSTLQTKDKQQDSAQLKYSTTLTYFTTHTKTMSVTITQTTVVQRDGHPSTHTIIQTKTHTTTLIDTVTEIQTVLQPTSVLSTVTTTIPVLISKSTVAAAAASPSSDPYPTLITATAVHDQVPRDNDSIFVIMSDKKTGTAHIVPTPPDARPTGFDVQVPDEANEISPNDILFSGIYTQHSDNECRPECKVTKNEMCQKIDGNMRCVCRPGFARMFPDHPCKPTYTYVMRMPLERQGIDQIHYTDSLADRTSPSHQQLTEAARDGLDRMVMQSDLRDIYRGIVVSGFEPAKKSDRAAVVYIVQLSENADEIKLQDEIHETLKANNFSLGGTDVYAAQDMYHSIQAEDFDECNDNKYHDCSENAQCFNLRGTYTCSCKEGFSDVSYNTEFPGRICSADTFGCELCNYHGNCYYKTDDEPTCECFQWYAGDFCQVNLKVTLITLITIGVLLSVLLIVYLVMTCCSKQKRPEILGTAPKPHVGFRRYHSANNLHGDKRAIVSVDTSSEGSVDRTPPPFVKQRVLRSEPPPPPNPLNSHGSGETVQSAERDRSLRVLIPRVKYRPLSSQPTSTLLTMSTFGPEQKLLNYAASRESSRTPEKKMSRCSIHTRKLSDSTNLSVEPTHKKKNCAPTRPSSGALISAGFEVSATVRRTQELDEAYINETSHDLNQPTYNSIRTAERTVSEARSYDETTVQPPVRSLHHIFHLRTHTCDSKHSSSHKDEHHTMGERDLGSTYMTKSQLYKPDLRESDGSNFDSL